MLFALVLDVVHVVVDLEVAHRCPESDEILLGARGLGCYLRFREIGLLRLGCSADFVEKMEVISVLGGARGPFLEVEIVSGLLQMEGLLVLVFAEVFGAIEFEALRVTVQLVDGLVLELVEFLQIGQVFDDIFMLNIDDALAHDLRALLLGVPVQLGSLVLRKMGMDIIAVLSLLPAFQGGVNIGLVVEI